MRQWLSNFTLSRALNGAWPEWFWDWASNATFVSAYSDDDEEVPF
jgi:hypothetical protein